MRGHTQKSVGAPPSALRRLDEIRQFLADRPSSIAGASKLAMISLNSPCARSAVQTAPAASQASKFFQSPGTAGRRRWYSGPGYAGCRRNCPLLPTSRIASSAISSGPVAPDRGFDIALDLLEDLAIHDEFLGARDQPALQPAGGVIDHVGARLHRRPERVRGLPHRLPVRHVGRADAGGPQRQVVEPRHLPGHLRRAHVFGRAEGGRAGFHVDVRGEGADRAGASRASRTAPAPPRRAPRPATAPPRPPSSPAPSRPASVNGVTTTACPRRRSRIQPSIIG